MNYAIKTKKGFIANPITRGHDLVNVGGFVDKPEDGAQWNSREYAQAFAEKHFAKLHELAGGGFIELEEVAAK